MDNETAKAFATINSRLDGIVQNIEALALHSNATATFHGTLSRVLNDIPTRLAALEAKLPAPGSGTQTKS